MSMFSQKKPYSAVTTQIELLTSEDYPEDDLSGLVDLIEVIKLQVTGPSEAARALRKKLKYGNTHRQLRALTIMDALISNAGPRFQRAFVDEPLLERLRVCGTSDLSPPEVKKKAMGLFAGWTEYSKTPGLERLARLHSELPKRKQVVTQERSKAVRETENPFGADDDEEPPRRSPPPARHGESSRGLSSGSHARSSSNTGSSSFFGSSKDKKNKDKKGKRKSFNLEAEKEQMKNDIAEASIATTNFSNALQSINREREQISNNEELVRQFEACKILRRKILRYIHHIESEQYLGSLLHANDELVTALMTFEQLDRSIDADSDSDDELAEQQHIYRMVTEKAKQNPTGPPDVSGLSLDAAPRQPPRPGSKPSSTSPSQGAAPTRPPRPPVQPVSDDEDDDDDDPFSDKNVVQTPALEKEQPRW